jgi:hypothetical protein
LVKIKRFFPPEEARMRNFTSSSNVLLILLCYPEIRIIVGAGFIHPAFTIGYIHAINRRADKSSPYYPARTRLIQPANAAARWS